ncbi:MAG: HAD family hydrolase [Bacilli bacterium]|jgi:Cof subfamily protein (haloacid dehalogenase superfamily)|nr:HAD family hydrolase [Bacilli bacterium]
MRKLFCFDIDKTLLPAGQDVFPEKEKLALRSLHEKRDAVAIASGRNYDGIVQYLEKEQIPSTYIIAGNGAAIYGEKGLLLDEHPLTLGDLYLFRDLFYGPEATNVYALGRDNSIYLFKDDPHTDFEIAANKLKLVKRLDAHESLPLDDPHLLKVLLSNVNGDTASFRLTKAQQEKYDAVFSSPQTFEIMAKGMDKAYGVEFLRKHLGIAPKDVYCFGDAGNDVGMLGAFNGIAMGEATSECRKVCKMSTKSAQDDGVYFALHDLLGEI